jgi:hypothetical protein
MTNLASVFGKRKARQGQGECEASFRAEEAVPGQRMVCFLKDRWKSVQPARMYGSKGKALDMFTTEGDEFRKLYDVVVDLLTLPEFIQSEFSRGDSVKGGRFGKLRAVNTQEATR